MIGKQTKGRGFRKLLDYLESREDAKLIGGNMSGRNARELAREFKLSRQLNSDADRVVYHVSLSAAKGDKLDDEKWSEIGDRYMKEMGFDANQFVIFRHHNTDDDHIHIAASRIRMDTGLVVHDSWDYIRSEKVLRQIEQDYELVQVQGSREKLNRTPSTGQIRRIRREQEEYSSGKRDTPPERVLHKYLSEKRYIPDYISQGLHNNQLLYMDEQRNILFIKRDLDGEKTGALIWSKPRENHRTVEYDQNTSTQKGWFYLRLGGQPTDKVENVFLCSTPIDAMSAATYLISSCKGLPPTRTMLIVADDPNNLPMEFLKTFNRVVVAFNNDDLGNFAASAVLELLPQGKRLKTHNPDWSQELGAIRCSVNHGKQSVNN